jgi:DNA helicase II / ATP-dependent DNA helicase PcrA
MADPFLTAYKRLNQEQKKAVDAIEGPVMVIAGPGTGKTQILTLRIANILRTTDTAPENILALTFTESAVFSMRRRLAEFLGSDAYRVRISTFHGFANDLIARFPDSFPRIIGSRLITDVERIEAARTLILETELAHLRPFGDNYYYVRPVLSQISELKRENISSDEYEAMLAKNKDEFTAIPDLYNEKGAYKGQMKGKYATRQKRMAKDRELLTLYRGYEELLRARRLYDYDDMLLEAIKALTKERDLLLSLQEEHQYVLADEHQDANGSQNALLELLSSFHDNPNLFIVGDEKQAIFRFQGASLENFLYFTNRYPDALVIALRENYRSTQDILDSAHALMSRSSAQIERVPLIASGQEGRGAIALAELGTPRAEAAYIAEHVANLIGEGAEPQDIAVLFRVNRSAENLAEALERKGIPVMVESDQNMLTDIDMRRFLALLRALGSYGQTPELIPALHLSFLGLDALDVARVLSQARHGALFGLISTKKSLLQLGIKNTAPFMSFAKNLRSWHSALHNKGLLAGLEIVARESGFIGELVAGPSPYEKLGALSGLFAAAEDLVRAKQDATAEDFVRHLDLMDEYRLSVKAPRTVDGKPAVRLMTAHRAKGLEFLHVVIAHANDGMWGNRREPSYFSPIHAFAGTESDELTSLDDERRLFYVALTRAKISILMTYARQSETGTPLLPTRFLEEVDKELITRVETATFDAGYSPALSRLSARIPARLDRDLVQKLFAEQGLSVTALNSYLDCPWRYFYLNLLRVPQVPNKHAALGTAVHAALRQYFDLFKAGEDIGASGLCARFERVMREAPLPRGDIEEGIAKGRKALESFYEARKETLNPQAISEFRVTVFMPTDIPGLPEMSGFPSLRLRGDLDRVELAGDGSATVFDYKTGRRKTRKEVFGTDETWGDYKRQIVFYALLLSRYEGGKHRMSQGVIEFVEPDEKGRHERYEIAPTDEDLERLTREIVRVAKEIMDLSFADRRCDDADCPWCELREFAALSENPAKVSRGLKPEKVKRKRPTAKASKKRLSQHRSA